MIARLAGTVAYVEANVVILDVQGVGYKVFVPVTTLDHVGKIGDKTTLEIHTSVREDDISLYGFSTIDERKAFELLISVSGIGPKVALSILSAMDVRTLANAVAIDDTRTLVRVPGLGLKTAQKLILELRDKMAYFALEQKAGQSQVVVRRPSADMVLDDVIEGLIGLGFNRNEARRAAERSLKDVADPSNPTMTLKLALNILTGAK
jgi:holliday junction DNA helicase RuvA